MTDDRQKKTLPFRGAARSSIDDHHPNFLKRRLSQSSLVSKLLTIWLVPSHIFRAWQSRNASASVPMNMWYPAGTLRRWYFSFTAVNLLQSPFHCKQIFELFSSLHSPETNSCNYLPIGYRHGVGSTHSIMSDNKKDGFTGTLILGDRLFPESIDLGLGTIVTADNIEELTSIFTNEPVHFVNTI